MRRRHAAALVAAALLGLAGCDKWMGPAKSPFQGIDVTGGDMGGEIRLADAEGRPRSLAEFRGKVVVLIFGYTHCPDVCPTSLADAAKARRALEGDASQVQVLFVTVDPKRDTPEVLRQYVPAFDPSFIGLHGDAAAIAKVTKDFHVYVNARETRDGNYTVDHSGQMFVIDREGKVRLVWPPGIATAAMTSDLKVLLRA